MRSSSSAVATLVKVNKSSRKMLVSVNIRLHSTANSDISTDLTAVFRPVNPDVELEEQDPRLWQEKSFQQNNQCT